MSKVRRSSAAVRRTLVIGLVAWQTAATNPIAWAVEALASKTPESAAPAAAQTALGPAEATTKASSEKVQGPAIDDVQEILQVLNQRKEYLARKEEALKEAEARIAALKADAEKILDRYEKVTKAAIEKQEEQAKKKAQAQLDSRKATVLQAVKMFESMPPEEAASRIDKMPEKSAMELLRELKPKTAGSILAQMKPERAAKIAEKFLGPVSRESLSSN